MSITQLFVIFLACGTLTLAASKVEMQATQASSLVTQRAIFYYANLAGFNDLAFTADMATSQAKVLKRGADGLYNLFATMPLTNVSLSTTTNGDWFGSIFDSGVELFRVDQNGQVHDYSVVETTTNDFTAKLLEDGSLMVVFTDAIFTYEFINAAWVVTQNTSFPGAQFYVSALLPASFSGNAFIVLNASAPYEINIITRQADKSWKIVETVPVNETFVSEFQTTFWDGKDTLILGSPTVSIGETYGAVFVFNKINGDWKHTQSFFSAEVGLAGVEYLGLGPLIALDNDNVLVCAPLDGISEISTIVPGSGSVFVMQRNQQNQWSINARITVTDSGFFGAGLASNTHDILAFGCHANETIFCQLYTVPTCIVEPIDFTCKQQDSCSTDLDDLVVINNPLCGQVSTSVDHITTQKSGIVLDVTLSKPLVADAKCSVTVTCAELTSVSSGQVLISSMALISMFVAFILL